MRDSLALTALAVLVLALPAAGGQAKPRVPPAPAAVEPPPPPALPPAADAVRQAAVLCDEGKPAEAEALLRPYLDRPPVEPVVRLALADALSDLDRLPEAADQWARALRDRPDDDDTRLRLADAWLGLQQPDSALELYQQALSRRPDDPSLRRRTGMLLADMDRGAEAIPHMEAYTALVPGDEEALARLRDLYAWNDRPADALRLLERRVKDHPEDLEALRELADRSLDASDEPRAILLYERLVKALPGDLAARRSLGELYEWNGRPREALAQYEAYLEARPYDADMRARALSLSSDLGLGSRARRHGNLLRSSDKRFRDLARESVLADTGLASWLGLEYAFFHQPDRLAFHGIGPRGAWQFRDDASLGAFYQFRHFRGPTRTRNGRDRTVTGHAVGAFAQADLPLGIQLALGASWHHYDTGFDSANGHLVLSRDFEKVSLAAEFRRADVTTGIGDLETQVVANTLSLAVDSEPVERLLLHFSGTFGVWSDWNQRWSATAGVGVRAVDSPQLELWYEWDYEGFRYPGRRYPKATYFAPDHYHLHGPRVSLTHAVKPWFAYGLDLHLWHAYGEGDNALLLQVGPKVTFRPGGRHLIQASYQRSDEVWGRADARYQDNLLLFTYAYEF